MIDAETGRAGEDCSESFPSNELQRYRVHKAREQAQGRELARTILADPDATENDREWARVLLGEA